MLTVCPLLSILHVNYLSTTIFESYSGPALVTTKDAGDAVTLLQSLAGSTFDSSQLVLTACMGYQNVTESRLQELRNKHRPAVKAALEERSKGLKVWRDSQGLASKLYGFNQDPGSVAGTNKTDQAFNRDSNGNTDPSSANVDGLYENINKNLETDSGTDLQEQVTSNFYVLSTYDVPH